MTNKLKTLLKTSAALVTLFAGSQSWGAATVVDQLTTISSVNGTLTADYNGAAAAGTPTFAASGATDLLVCSRVIIGEAANKTLTLGTTAAALQPLTYALQIASISGANTIEVSIPTLAPGDVVKIYDGALFTGARTLTVSAFAYGTNWTEADKIKYAKKVATVEWTGPLEPSFAERAGIDFKYKKATTLELAKKLMP